MHPSSAALAVAAALLIFARAADSSPASAWLSAVRGCGGNASIAPAGEELLGCVRARALRALDRLVERDVLALPFGWQLIRDRDAPEDSPQEHRRRAASPSVDMLDAALTRAARLLRTHSLRIPLPRSAVEGRRRHRHKDGMMGLMLFGVMAMTVIAIPLGFQFLAVLGGKALMLAKLALILTSIQGLKKIATSNISYGLYHAPTAHAHGSWPYDRRWQATHPQDEHAGLFEGFDAPESHALDAIRPRIMLPRVGPAPNQQPA